MSALGEGAKQDERDLWAALLAGQWPRFAGERLGIPQRRVEYLCEKWSRKGIYDYGVVCDLGWPNPAGSVVVGSADPVPVVGGEDGGDA